MEPAEPVNVVADNLQPGPGIGKQRRRRTLPKAVAFWILAGLFLILFFASSAASPLYRVYQAQFHFSAATLTAVFAVYVLVLLVTLLLFGSVSDYLGRLPVIIGARLQRGRVRGLPSRARSRGTICGQIPARHRGRPGQRADRGRADRPATAGQPAGAVGDQRLLHPGPGSGRADHQHACPVRPGTDPPHLVDPAGRLRRQHPHRSGHGRTRVQAPRCPGLAAASDRRTAPGTGNLRRSRSLYRRGMGPRRPVSVAGAVAGSPGHGFAEPAVGRPGHLPALRDRGRGGICAAQRQPPGGAAGWLPVLVRGHGSDVRRDRDDDGTGLPCRHPLLRASASVSPSRVPSA